MVQSLVRALILSLVFIALAGASGYLTLSLIVKSEDITVVPDLIGLDAKQATAILSTLGLKPSVGTALHHAQIPKDHVFDQDPPPGTEIKEKRVVHVSLSLGAKQVSTPELIGLSLPKARIRLEENELCLGAQAQVYGYQPNPETVMAQSPPVGALIRAGTCVDLLISLGLRPERFIMPDVKGFSLRAATMALASKGFTVRIERATDKAGHPPLRVAAQHPRAGSAVFAGSPVRLTAGPRTGARGNGPAAP